MIKYLVYNETLDDDEQVLFFSNLEAARQNKIDELNCKKEQLKFAKEHPENFFDDYIELLEEDIQNYDNLVSIYELKEVK